MITTQACITLVVFLQLFQVIAGLPKTTDELAWALEDNNNAEQHSSESSGSEEAMRVKDEPRTYYRSLSNKPKHESPCKYDLQIKNPQTFFNTNDKFFPRFYYEKGCTGTPVRQGYPTCGRSGFMDCVNETKTLYFRRWSSSSKCLILKRARIPRVSIGCHCMKRS